MANILHRTIHSNTHTAASLLHPSAAIAKASPIIASILASYGENIADSDHHDPSRSRSQNDDPISSSATSKPKFVSSDDLREWHTPNIPILTPRQLELSLLEIRRRQRRRQEKQVDPPEQNNQSSTETTATTAKYANKQAAILVPLCTVQGIPSVLFTRRSAQLSSHASQISFPGGYYDEQLDSNNKKGMKIIESWKDRLVNTALREMHEELQYDLSQMGLDDHSDYNSPERNKNEDITITTTTTTNSNSQSNLQKSNKLPLVTILGQTQPVPSMTGSVVTPIIGTINYDLPHHTCSEFKALFPGNPEEVDWIFTVPISELIKSETSEPLRRWSTSYSDVVVTKKNADVHASGNGNDNDNDNTNEKKKDAPWGPVFPVPECDEKKQEGDKIWGLTAIVLRPLLSKVFGPVFGRDGLGLVEAGKKDTVNVVAKL